jgi:hypothetical protein
VGWFESVGMTDGKVGLHLIIFFLFCLSRFKKIYANHGFQGNTKVVDNPEKKELQNCVVLQLRPMDDQRLFIVDDFDFSLFDVIIPFLLLVLFSEDKQNTFKKT